MKWKVQIKTMLKKSIVDPQGQAVKGGLDALGYTNIDEVHVGKYLELLITGAKTIEEVEKQVNEMCQRLLANPVIEDYTFQVEKVEG